VSLFIDPDKPQVEASAETGAKMIELHTGAFANAEGQLRADELKRLEQSARLGKQHGLQVNAGHGLNYENLAEFLTVPSLTELNIGHSIVSRAVFVGFREAVQEMKSAMASYAQEGVS